MLIQESRPGIIPWEEPDVKATMPTLNKRLKSLLVGTKKVPPWPPDLSLREALKLFKRRTGISSKCTRDVTKTTLVFLAQSADSFPLLKSTCNSVLTIWETAERVTRCRRDTQDVATRCYDILVVIADSVDDPSAMSSGIQNSIVKFNNLLHDIEADLKVIRKQSLFKRLTHLNRQEVSLNAFKQRLDEASKDIVMATTL